MIQSASGVILRTRLLTETSLIVHWLTPQFGRISTVAKGARRPKSPYLGKLDLFYECDFNFSRSRRSDLHTLREVGLRETHSALRQEIRYLQQAAYAAALVEQSTETDTPLRNIYTLIRDLVNFLPGQPPLQQTVFAFELKLLAELGQQPDLSKTSLTVGSRKIAMRLVAEDWAAIARLKLGDAQATELSRFLHGYLIYHLGRIPKGRNAAIGVAVSQHNPIAMSNFAN